MRQLGKPTVGLTRCLLFLNFAECHATGTAVGDIIELDAIGSVYGDARPEDQPLRVASVKSNIGHAELAAGIFSITKVFS
jgi:acyl transferase domain-containing protein